MRLAVMPGAYADQVLLRIVGMIAVDVMNVAAVRLANCAHICTLVQHLQFQLSGDGLPRQTHSPSEEHDRVLAVGLEVKSSGTIAKQQTDAT